MDRVRFGRALGYGTRHMAKTLAAAAEAAAASPGEPPRTARREAPAKGEVLPPPRAATTGSGARSAVRPGVRSQQLKRSFWQPLAVYSGALWLRVTGTFFALLAVTMGGGAWRVRGDLGSPAGPRGAHHFWIFLVFTGLFGYFAVSSFIRAGLKERRAAGGR